MSSQRHLKRRVLTVIVAASLAIVSGCSSSGDSTDRDSSGVHNSADVAFATDMMPHHAQAIEMADLALERSGSTAVVNLAEQIKNAQDPEIRKMGETMDDRGHGMGPRMGSMDKSMAGMMSRADMKRLAHASGVSFDRMWLTMMVEHHHGAISMAKTELSDGDNADAKALAGDIIDGQQVEIATMQGVLQDIDSTVTTLGG